MIKIPIIATVGNETLAGLILKKEAGSQPPQCVFFHGGGPSSHKERAYEIADPLLATGKDILTFDFSGHGQSTGNLKTGSLKKRVIEAKTITDSYAPSPSIICGASMGGYIALKLLELHSKTVDTLILMCPALYDSNAYDVPFDQGFTEIIRSHESWRTADVLQTLAAFRGNLLIIMGDKDEVIPSGVIDLIMQHTTQTKKRELYIIPGCPHKINTWIVEQPDELRKLHEKIAKYIL